VVRDVAIDHVWTAVRFKRTVPPVHFRAPLREHVLEQAGSPLATTKRSTTGRGVSGRKPATRAQRIANA